jgi:hypothetical protein
VILLHVAVASPAQFAAAHAHPFWFPQAVSPAAVLHAAAVPEQFAAAHAQPAWLTQAMLAD